ncbi:hypothetical protein GCM10007981_11630 [Thermocladium modestius]|uniref:Uncharacterized protein n=1 Tax=Thermocladium modestius TaxID=62609 RepID=A0A830GYR9_9CREN|nr:hypothetical protein [Thermocladium modestius]GGP21118.1 hypothetical protein GCM10007981_11630 [Thermocladium modestius]
MALGFAEDMDCEEIRRQELIGSSARMAIDELRHALQGGGVYALVGEYGTGKTFLLRKLSTIVDGLHIVNLRRGNDVSCSNSLNGSSMYAIDNFEMLLRKPAIYADKVREIINSASFLVVSISTSGGPIYGGSIVEIHDILSKLQGAKKIRIEVGSDEASKIIKSAGITVNMPLLMKTPGLIIRAFGGRKSSNDDTYTLI